MMLSAVLLIVIASLIQWARTAAVCQCFCTTGASSTFPPQFGEVAVSDCSKCTQTTCSVKVKGWACGAMEPAMPSPSQGHFCVSNPGTKFADNEEITVAVLDQSCHTDNGCCCPKSELVISKYDKAGKTMHLTGAVQGQCKGVREIDELVQLDFAGSTSMATGTVPGIEHQYYVRIENDNKIHWGTYALEGSNECSFDSALASGGPPGGVVFLILLLLAAVGAGAGFGVYWWRKKKGEQTRVDVI